MKNVWKRTLSLMLSGVLLMGSVPMGAFAAEQTQEPTELVEEIPPVVAVVKDEVANVELDVPKVCVNDTEIASGDVFSNGTVVYDAAQKTLTLNEATNLTGISVEGQSLTINLVGSNKIDAVDAVAITADKDLTITGEGSLEIVTNNAVAVSVAGMVDGENKKGLIIDGAQVSVETAFVETETEIPVGIASENGVVIKGAAHFRTSHSRSADKYTMECNGYLNGEVYTANSACDGGSALELIGDEHVGEWIEGDSEHYKTCAEATCALYQNTKVGNHSIDGTSRYESISNTQHRKLYSCCDKVQNGFEAEDHDLRYSKTDSAIQVTCADCKETGSITLSANDTEMGSEELDVSYTTAGILADEKPTITYTNAEGGVVTPEALGKYTVTMSYEGQTVTKEIEITKINISSKAVVTVGGTYTYDGNAQVPALADVTVKLGDTVLSSETDYTVIFSNNINAGEAVVTVKAVENSNYMGTAVGKFPINPKKIDGMVKLGPALVYNGEEQTQSVVAAAENSDVTFEVRDNKQTNAGDDYELTVEGTGNYADEVKLKYSVAKSSDYTDVTKQKQIVGTGMGALQMPRFEGFRKETVDGTYTYQWNGSEVDVTGIPSKVAELEDGDSAILSYTFKPAVNGNYTAEEKNGNIDIKKVELSFVVENEDGEMETATANNAVTILAEEKRVFGQAGIVTPKSIRALHGSDADSTPNYIVKYQKGMEPEQDAPSAGKNNYIVYYSGTINNEQYQNVKVLTGTVSVAPKKPEPTAVPVAKKLIFNNENQGLVEPGTPEVGELQYSLYKEHGYASTVPKQKSTGAYYVWYKEVTPDNDNYVDSEPKNVVVVIAPELKATYKQQLKDIKEQLKGFTWNEENPETNYVGDAGTQKVKLNYTPSDTVNYPTITDGYEVPLTVLPKQINATIALEKTHYKYALTPSGGPSEQKPKLTVEYTDVEEVAVDAEETTSQVLDDKEYTVDYENNEYPGTAKVKVTSKNYKFVDGTTTEDGSTIEESFIIYRPGIYNLTTVPTTLNGIYIDKSKIEEALVKGLEDNHEKDDMVFYNVKMQEYVPAEKKWESTTDETYFPEKDGYFTFAIAYPTGTNKSTKFEAVAINTMKERSREVTPIKLEPKDEKLEFKMESYAVVCLAWDGYNDNSTFKVTTSATNGTVKFTVGSDTTAKTTADAVKVKDKITVTATPKSGYALTGVKYTYNSGAFSVKVEQDSSGKYVFEMPAKDINITANFEKKTTNTKNPYSGDSSNIYLWVVILAASGAAIGALMAFWFKKRKK